MAAGRLLVIAPDLDLRNSLAFALEAEGYDVTIRTDIGTARADAGAFDCVVLDHRAAVGPIEDVLAFCRKVQPVVLLAGTPLPWLSAAVFKVVEKPQLGEPLSVAIKAALTESAASQTH